MSWIACPVIAIATVLDTGMDWWKKIRPEVSRGERKKRGILRRERDRLRDVKEDNAPLGAPLGIVLKTPAPSRRLARTLSGSLKSSKRTEPCRRNNATRPSGSMSACGRWGTKVNPGEGSGEGASARKAKGVHAPDPSARRGAGGFWVCAAEGFTFYETNMKGLTGNDCVKILPAQETLTLMPRILEGSGVRSLKIWDEFHSGLYRTSCKERRNSYILLFF